MYLTFRRYSVDYDLAHHRFSLFYSGKGAFVKDAAVKSVVLKDGRAIDIKELGKPVGEIKRLLDRAHLKITYHVEDSSDIVIEFVLSAKETVVYFGNGEEKFSVAGLTHWGDHDQQETMAVNLKGAGKALRSAYGPAASIYDDTLFDKDSDSAITFASGGKFRLRYDWAADAYGFSFETNGWVNGNLIKMHVEKDVYARKFDLDYKKLNKDATFNDLPVGWMTWYAVQFNAGEKTILENTKWQEENLKSYGANSVWVDWEWYHPNHSSGAPEDVDMFHPNKRMYPNGMKYISDKIKEAGFVPALWIGPTCDVNENEMMKKYPETVMTRKAWWSGQYFFDPTHPIFLDEILPKMVQQPIDWGYEAIKWDILGTMSQFCDIYRDKRYNSEISSREAMLGAFRKAREMLGPDYYMLYCAGATEKAMDMACGIFDAARIGGDIFRWDTFINECIDKTLHYYPLHTVVINNDPDNVIVRDKFNSYEQAITRAAFVSLTGMPFTLGDDLPKLGEDRVEILKRSIPPVPARPMDIVSAKRDSKIQIVNLAVEKPFMSYNVVDVMNLNAEKQLVRVDLKGDIGLDDGEYYVYDYWNKKFIGKVSGEFAVELKPFESGIYAVHKVQDVPQVISTSRHISQGAVDIVSLRFDPESYTLIGESNVVGGEDYEVIACAKEGLRIFYESDNTSTAKTGRVDGNAWKCVFKPEKDGLFKWKIRFHPQHGSGIRMVF